MHTEKSLFSRLKQAKKNLAVPVCPNLPITIQGKSVINPPMKCYTYIEESAGREGQDPGGSGLQGLDRVQGERAQGAQHTQAGRPHLGLSSLPSN